MSLQSLQFFAFMALVLAVNHALRHRADLRKPFLLVASYAFYALWDWRFVGALALLTAMNHVAARRIAASGILKNRPKLLPLIHLTPNTI